MAKRNDYYVVDLGKDNFGNKLGLGVHPTDDTYKHRVHFLNLGSKDVLVVLSEEQARAALRALIEAFPLDALGEV